MQTMQANDRNGNQRVKNSPKGHTLKKGEKQIFFKKYEQSKKET